MRGSGLRRPLSEKIWCRANLPDRRTPVGPDKLSPLRQRMIEDLTIRNLSPETPRSYVHHVAKFSRFFGRSPDQLGYEEVRAYQAHLVGRRVSWGALNQTVCALRFFYGVTLGRSDLPERIAYARTPRKLPVVLSADEVVGFLQAVKGTRNRVALMTTYAVCVFHKLADTHGVHPYCETEKLRDNSMLVSSNAAFSDGVDKVFSYSSGVR